MNFSDMRLQIINGVKWYFNRNWNRNDMMNFDEIPEQVHTTLMKVYLILFCAMYCSTFGSFMQWISVAGGKFTVLSYVTNLILLYIIPPGRVNTRFLLLMLAAYSFGASVSAFPNYLFEIKQRAITTRKRSEIYRGCMKYCFVLPLYALVFIVLDNSRSSLLMIKIHTMQILFMGYLMIYSQEILYDADFGDINLVNCTLTVFFHLPGIVIHAATLYLQGAGIDTINDDAAWKYRINRE